MLSNSQILWTNFQKVSSITLLLNCGTWHFDTFLGSPFENFQSGFMQNQKININLAVQLNEHGQKKNEVSVRFHSFPT